MKLIDQYRTWRMKRVAKKYFGSLNQSIDNHLIGGRETQSKWERQFMWYDGVIKRNHLHQRSVMETLSFIRDISPDASMAIWNFLRLANNGHELDATDSNGNPDESALDYINSLAARVGKLYGGGTDQLINVMLLTGYTQGAIALEVELEENLKDVRDFHALDPSRLDFQVDKDTQETKLVQKQVDGSYKELNPNQVFYQPFDPDVDDPYGRSPILPVLQIIFFQVEVLKDLKQVAHHQGHARFDVSVVEESIMNNIPPQIKAQGESAVRSFVTNYISDINSAFKKLKPDDNFFHTDSVKVDMSGGTQGKSMDGTALINIINQQVTTALKQLPVLLGHNDTVTETHGTVQYQIFVAGVESIRRGVKRMLERAYNLALQVQGSQSTAKLTFNEIRVTDRMKDAQAAQQETNTLITQVKQGWIDNDEAANQAVGHDAVGEPQAPDISNVLRSMPIEQRGASSKKSKTGKGGDDFVKELETGYADDLAKLTTSTTDALHKQLSDQLATYQSRIKKSGTPPTRVLMVVVRSVEKRSPGIPPEFERWVKVHILNDSDGNIREWNDKLVKWMEQAADIAGEATLAELTTDLDFNSRDTQLLRWLQERSLRDADLIQGVTDEDVIQTLWDTVIEGKYTINKAAENLQQSFSFSKGRSRTIARTELISAGRSGQFHADRQSGMVIGKTWHSTYDGRTRHAHAEADGQTVKFDDPFIVWGEQLMFPGDGGSAKNVVNCRCFYTRILQGEEDKLGKLVKPDDSYMITMPDGSDRPATVDNSIGIPIMKPERMNTEKQQLTIDNVKDFINQIPKKHQNVIKEIHLLDAYDQDGDEIFDSAVGGFDLQTKNIEIYRNDWLSEDRLKQTLAGTLRHETAHALQESLGEQFLKDWGKAIKKDVGYITDYAKTDMYEDIAETIMYHWSPDSIERRTVEMFFPERFKVLNKYGVLAGGANED
ncbi:phage minor head protein [Sporolactobacillus sp. STSJ-5]|uniref:phage minor head protein n=1 Tax=Sporolactobacillus sp. STSJ-5 TaxID=2965076 RepID=UPI0021030F3B|nr:phage minor head protein [Sporolactobacillus sp. STSJ-5]MCQ2010555.1 phage minor head protein [Sporolactobacillus sp. STSJ-5]